MPSKKPDDRAPATAAGQRMLRVLARDWGPQDSITIWGRRSILAIEAEAATDGEGVARPPASDAALRLLLERWYAFGAVEGDDMLVSDTSAALADNADSGVPAEPTDQARRFAYWFTGQPYQRQLEFIHYWLREHPNAVRVPASRAEAGEATEGGR